MKFIYFSKKKNPNALKMYTQTHKSIVNKKIKFLENGKKIYQSKVANPLKYIFN